MSFPFIQVDCLPGEVFKQIPQDGIPGIKPDYCVSNCGRLFNLKTNRFVEGRSDENGYKRVGLLLKNGSRRYIGIHRLVLLAFDYTPNHNKLVPNHVNGIVDDNYLTNLEWTTYSENTRHAISTGLMNILGEDSHYAKLTDNIVREICEKIQTGNYSDAELAREYNMSHSAIESIHKHRSWTHISKDYNLDITKPRVIDENQARNICEMIESGLYTAQEIADELNIPKTCVDNIKRGNSWKNISKDYDMSVNKVRKFTAEEVEHICELMETKQYSDREIARIAGSSKYMIYALRTGKIWKEITKKYNI